MFELGLSGLSGALVGGAVGAVAGGIVGGVVGAVVDGTLTALSGGNFFDGFSRGLIIGAIAGGIAGAFQGASLGANGGLESLGTSADASNSLCSTAAVIAGTAVSTFFYAPWVIIGVGDLVASGGLSLTLLPVGYKVSTYDGNAAFQGVLNKCGG